MIVLSPKARVEKCGGALPLKNRGRKIWADQQSAKMRPSICPGKAGDRGVIVMDVTNKREVGHLFTHWSMDDRIIAKAESEKYGAISYPQKCASQFAQAKRVIAV